MRIFLENGNLDPIFTLTWSTYAHNWISSVHIWKAQDSSWILWNTEDIIFHLRGAGPGKGGVSVNQNTCKLFTSVMATIHIRRAIIFLWHSLRSCMQLWIKRAHYRNNECIRINIRISIVVNFVWRLVACESEDGSSLAEEKWHPFSWI